MKRTVGYNAIYEAVTLDLYDANLTYKSYTNSRAFNMTKKYFGLINSKEYSSYCNLLCIIK